MLKSVSNPVRVAKSIERLRLPLALATRPFNVGFPEHRLFNWHFPRLACGDINLDRFPQSAARPCHSTDQGVGRAKHSRAVEVSRSSLDFDRARSKASLQANRAGSDLGGAATSDGRRDFRRDLCPICETSERWRALPVVLFLRPDGLDVFLARITARRKQCRS